ncbi:MAG TPA: CheR family methyltransferase [Steroidobacteraceae bacterium]
MSSAEFPVVGIGASAGGLDAFHAFFEKMPANCGMAFVVILHLPADHKSMLIEILDRWTSMPVLEGVDGTRLEPNHVYVPPPHGVTTVVDAHLSVEAPADGTDRQFRPIDDFFDSLGTVLKERAVGIVLSGTGSDGALGLKAIKERGGFTIAQGKNGSAPQYGEMPAGAIATGAVDLVAPVEEIPGHLLRLKRTLIESPAGGVEGGASSESARIEICAILRSHLGHDFSDYRRQTFLRRVERRRQVLNLATLEEYIATLNANPAEATLLFRDLLIRVTSFFRDRETFQILADEIIPRLFDGKMADSVVRVWVPACATGEEAYSLAMLLREHLDSLTAKPKVQIFATDIDDLAIATARLGRYPRTLVEGVDDARRQRFFNHSHGSYCVAREIRDLCTFSVHNLVRDPPFSQMSLVSCRNLLIYLNAELQGRVIPVFHYALIPGGILLLGGSESVAQHPGLFEAVDKKARIFRRRQGRSPELNLRWQYPRSTSLGPSSDGGHPMGSVQSLAQGEAWAARGRAADEADRPSSTRHDRLLGPVTPTPEIIVELQRALAETGAELQLLAEEHQTALEELRSANEELHSVNEELQSTNEELETSKEELQSLNEELHTVNVRLTEKIEELGQANGDLRNLFESTEIATVFLDRHLVIRSFTPAIATLYNLIPSDQGRPLTDIVSRLEYDSLREDVAFVLANLEPLERRIVRDDRSAHYVMRILPYREPDSAVTGVLITFVDVTSIVRAEEALVAADVRKDVFLATLSHELRNPLAPIRIAARLLQAPDLDPGELRHAQDIIARQVGHMSSLLDDLLDVSRITRGSFLLKKTYVDLQVLMDEAIEAVQAAIDAKQHTLRVERPAQPILLEVDPVRMTQVITNLLTNAVKYTPSGGLIQMGTRFEAQQLCIFVRDSGIGLSAEAMERVFDMFARIEAETGPSEGGLGIGLSLAKGLVELHGGHIQVRSAGRSQGSEFVICLPRSLIVDASADWPAHPGAAAEPTAPLRRILVADDNRDSADTMGMLLQLSGHEVHLAHSGRDALETAKRVRPDVGIFDIGMPDLSGYELAERIRHEAWGAGMTLIAVTGWGQDTDRRRALAAGFDHHLTKPIEPDQLEGLFNGAAPRGA